MATANIGQKKLAVINEHEGQFQYMGRWVNKEHFRAFVYNNKGDQQLADSYKDFDELISSGIWFAERKDVSQAPQKRKPKDGTLRADG